MLEVSGGIHPFADDGCAAGLPHCRQRRDVGSRQERQGDIGPGAAHQPAHAPDAAQQAALRIEAFDRYVLGQVVGFLGLVIEQGDGYREVAAGPLSCSTSVVKTRSARRQQVN